MALVKPSRPQFDPGRILAQAGQYFGWCRRVEQGIPNVKFPDRKPLVAIEFEIDDQRFPALRGKITSIVCTESIYRDPQTRQESHFLTHCRFMGARNPEKGVDPEQFIGGYFALTCELADGKAYVRAAIPMPAPVAGSPPLVPTPPVVDAPPLDADDTPPF